MNPNTTFSQYKGNPNFVKNIGGKDVSFIWFFRSQLMGESSVKNFYWKSRAKDIAYKIFRTLGLTKQKKGEVDILIYSYHPRFNKDEGGDYLLGEITDFLEKTNSTYGLASMLALRPLASLNAERLKSIDYWIDEGIKFKNYNLRDVIWGKYSRDLQMAPILLNAWIKTLKKANPKVFVTYYENGLGYWGIVASKLLGIPCVAIQHGIIIEDTYTPLEAHVSREKDDFINFVTPDYFIAYGEGEAKKLKGWRTVALGCPRYDKLKDIRKNADREEIFKKYNLDPTREVVVWATQGNDPVMQKSGEWEKIYEMVLETAKELKNTHQFIAKLHPKESTNYDYVYIGAHVLQCIKTLPHKKADLFELLSVADYCLTKHSTVGMESILAGVPLIITETEKYNDDTYDGCPHVKNKEELVEIFNRNLWGKDSGVFKMFRGFFIQEYFNNFGNSTQKVGEFISLLTGQLTEEEEEEKGYV